MVVNKGFVGFFVIQSSNKNQIGAYGRKRQKGNFFEKLNICVEIEKLT